MSKPGVLVRPKVVAFDIIETVFDIEPLDGRLTELGLPAGLHRRLYAETLRDTMALATVGGFAPFLDLMAGQLAAMASEYGIAPRQTELKEALTTMRALPPHSDAPDAFALLRKAGVRIIALSNGAEASTRALLDGAGLSELVEAVLSVEAVRLAKPRAEVYAYAVRTAAVSPGETMLVACHPWDINGAKSAGLSGAYVARGKPYPSAMARPDLDGANLLDVARAIARLPA